MATHRLKTWPESLALIVDGMKAWEMRKNDRDYKKDDVLELWEFEPCHHLTEHPPGIFSGWMLRVDVLHVAHASLGVPIPLGYVIMSILTGGYAFKQVCERCDELPPAYYVQEED